MCSPSQRSIELDAKTEVCITVDVEFSIAGAFDFPERYLPLGEEVTNCVVDGREEGLGFLLESLTRSGVCGTFFVEALQTLYFGDEPMGRIAQRIAQASHDVQLHLHPCWLHFRDAAWRAHDFEPNDSCAGRSAVELDEIIRLGQAAFARWGIPAPIALRAGGFRADRALYHAMARNGLPLASNISLGVFPPLEPELQLTSGRHLVHGVLEVPALSYRCPVLTRPWLQCWRTLAITATSRYEMESLLWLARREGVPTVVILTHPFEFVKKSNYRFSDLRVNRVNQQRFRRLLEFLASNREDFECVTFGGQGPAWLQAGTTAESRPLRIGTGPALLRAVENVLSDYT